MKIDEYISSTGVISDVLTQSKSTETNTATEVTEQKLDEYISGTENTTEPIPCENYNDILQVMRKADAQRSEEESTQATGGQPSGAGGGSDDSEEETTTKIVTINGITYLETTTVSDGVTSVTRSAIKGEGVADKTTMLEGEETKFPEEIEA